MYLASQVLGNESRRTVADFDLLVDASDGAAYILLTLYAHGQGHVHRSGNDIRLFRLTPDFANFTQHNTLLRGVPDLVEVPVLFQRRGTVYALTGGCSCFGLHGAGVSYATAPHPLGPYTQRSATLDPGCDLFKRASCLDAGPAGDPRGPNATGNCRPVTQAQQNFVIQYPTRNAATGAPDTGFIWTGDRWGSAPDGLKSMDPQTWAPLTFDDSQTPPAIVPLAWHDAFTINLTTPLKSDDAGVGGIGGGRRQVRRQVEDSHLPAEEPSGYARVEALRATAVRSAPTAEGSNCYSTDF